MENMWFVAAAWMGLALVASVISIRLGISVALVEMFVGVIGGNFLGFPTTPWIDFLATFGSGLLTFLAGAEIDPESLRKHLKPSLVIGGVSFLLPFLGAMAFAHRVVDDFGSRRLRRDGGDRTEQHRFWQAHPRRLLRH